MRRRRRKGDNHETFASRVKNDDSLSSRQLSSSPTGPLQISSYGTQIQRPPSPYTEMPLPLLVGPIRKHLLLIVRSVPSLLPHKSPLPPSLPLLLLFPSLQHYKLEMKSLREKEASAVGVRAACWFFSILAMSPALFLFLPPDPC